MPNQVMMLSGTTAQLRSFTVDQPVKVVHIDPRILQTLGPAAQPNPAPVAAPARGPALYIIEEYELVTVPGDFGVTRNVVSTLNIPGGGKKTLFFKTVRSETKSGTISETVLESQDKSVVQDMGRSMSSS